MHGRKLMIYDRLITRQTFHNLRRCILEQTNGFFLINFAILSHLNIRTAELSSGCCCCIHSFRCNCSVKRRKRKKYAWKIWIEIEIVQHTNLICIRYIFRSVDFLLLLLFVYLCNECGAAANNVLLKAYSSIYEHCEVNNLFRPSTTYNFNHIWK